MPIIPADKHGALRRGEISTFAIPRQDPKECRFRIAHTYKMAGTTIEVLGVGKFDTTAIDDAAAARMGFPTAGEWRAFWRHTQHGVMDPSEEPFKVGEPIWQVVFGLVDDPVRIPHKDSSRGYTRERGQALGSWSRGGKVHLSDEPEAVPADVQEQQSEEARSRFRRDWKDRDEEWRRLTRVQKQAELDRAAAMGGNELVRKHFRLIDEQQEKARRKLLRDPHENGEDKAA